MVRPRRQFPEVKDQKPLLSYKGHHISELVWMDEHFWPGKKMRGKCQMDLMLPQFGKIGKIEILSTNFLQVIPTAKEIRMGFFF